MLAKKTFAAATLLSTAGSAEESSIKQLKCGYDTERFDDPDDNYCESQQPIMSSTSHVLDLINEKGRYKDVEVAGDSNASTKSEESLQCEKNRLDVSVSINDIKDIDQLSDTFKCKIRIFMFWRVDLHAIGMDDVVARTQNAQHFSKMTPAEIAQFSELSGIPKIIVMNALEVDESDPADIRVYGGERGNTAVMWNKGYVMTCQLSFNLRNFPFDAQELHLDLRLNDPKTWDKFDLTVSTVQFYKQALQNAEWIFREPKIKRDSPRHKATNIKLQMNRHPSFYVQNIVYLFTGLVVMNLLLYAIPVEDAADRLLGVFTNILNAVAFKLNYSTWLPKASYNTLIDYYILENFVILGVSAVLVIVPTLYKEELHFANEVNMILLYLNIALIVLNICTFYLRVYVSVNGTPRMSEIELKDGHDWYCYRFSSPHYLPVLPAPVPSVVSGRHSFNGGSNNIVKAKAM